MNKAVHWALNCQGFQEDERVRKHDARLKTKGCDLQAPPSHSHPLGSDASPASLLLLEVWEKPGSGYAHL